MSEYLNTVVRLRPRQSSIGGELVYAHRAAFSAHIQAKSRTLGNEITYQGAVYTDAPESRFQYSSFDTRMVTQVLGFRDGFFQFKGQFITQDKLYELFQQKRLEIGNLVKKGKVSEKTYTDAINFLNTYERTAAEMLVGFENLSLFSAGFQQNPEGGSVVTGAHREHRDQTPASGDAITLTAAVLGFSTNYPLEKAPSSRIQPPDKSMCAHTRGVLHRSPDYEKQKRVAMTLGLLSRRD